MVFNNITQNILKNVFIKTYDFNEKSYSGY